MVDKQSNTLLINSVMRWMSFSVLSNKEILSVNVISLKHPSTLKHWKVVFRSTWTVVVVRRKGSEIRFWFQPQRSKKNSANDPFPSPNPALELKPNEWKSIFVKRWTKSPKTVGTAYNIIITNAVDLIITVSDILNTVVVHHISWLYFSSLIPFWSWNLHL